MKRRVDLQNSQTQNVRCPNDDQIQFFLTNEIESSDVDGLIRHLDGCQDCRQRLEQHAANPAFWQASSLSLQSDDFDVSADRSASANELSPVLKTLLAPSEDPHSLGRVGRFEILGVVGSGGMGTVLKARDVDIDRIVALKLPAAHLMDSPTSLERIEREARSAATIRHVSIIEIYQVERWREIPYLVMPFHTGPSLMSRLADGGKLKLLEAIRIARQVAEALAAAHDRGVVHRDVKPGNILLGKGTERAILTDFGIAKLDTDAQVTATGVIMGTPAFLSPEQASGGDALPQSDLFSLGTVLWSMLAGIPPFADLPTHTVVAKVAVGSMPDLRSFDSELPKWVYRLIDCLHHIDPAQRPESASQCAETLRQCEQHLVSPQRHPLPTKLTETKSFFRPCAVIASATLMVVTTAYLFVGSSGQLGVDPIPLEPTSAAQVTQRQAMIESLDQEVDIIDDEMAELMAAIEKMASQTQTELDSEHAQ
ncbi:MAG: serine/threonine-protein kinase [Pirellulaceae bacterium]